MLNKSVIQACLHSTAFKPFINLYVLDSVDSTNRFLKDLPASNVIDVCCAEMQTHGRGRFGRTWHSPYGENIYCSIRRRFNCNVSQLSGLGLVVSMAVLATLSSIDNTIRIKWPNDLIWRGKKLCGSLIEVMGNADVILGIGVNVNSVPHQQPMPEKPWCSLYEITGQHFDRNSLIAQLLIQLEQHLNQFTTHGFGSFLHAWQDVDYLHGQLITVSQPTGYLSGKASGVSDTGQLILIDEMGVTHYLSSGDTSLNHGGHAADASLPTI